MKFKVGEQVVANKSANRAYQTTQEGWEGEVIAVNEALGNMEVKDTEDKVYTVRPEHFDLVREKGKPLEKAEKKVEKTAKTVSEKIGDVKKNLKQKFFKGKKR